MIGTNGFYRIVIDDGKWIYFKNPTRKKNMGQPWTTDKIINEIKSAQGKVMLYCVSD